MQQGAWFILGFKPCTEQGCDLTKAVIVKSQGRWVEAMVGAQATTQPGVKKESQNQARAEAEGD